MPRTFTLISKISTLILQQTGKILQIDADLVTPSRSRPILGTYSIACTPIAPEGSKEMTDILERDNCYMT